MSMLITINEIIPLFCISQGFGNQADSDNVAEIFTYGKAFEISEEYTYNIEEVKRTASRYQHFLVL